MRHPKIIIAGIGVALGRSVRWRLWLLTRRTRTARSRLDVDVGIMRTLATERPAYAPSGPPATSSPARDTAPASRHRSRRRAAQAATILAVTVALVSVGVTERSALAGSVALLGHLRWICVAAAVALEAVSMAALASMQRRLLAAGGANVSGPAMLATTFAANALSVSVPLAGPELGTAFTFRRFTRQGADAPLAGWSLLAGGMVSAAAGALLVVGGALSSGNIVATLVAVAVAVLACAALAAVVTAARWPWLRGILERPAAWTLRHGSRLLRRPAEDPAQVIQSWIDRLGSLRLPPSGWITVTGLALANWLADAAVLTLGIHAVGAAVPWHLLLLAYGSGVGAQSLNITPGSVGITEGTLGLTLVAAGLRADQALAAVLFYRLISFWLVASAGWLTFAWLRRHRPTTWKPVRRPSTAHPGGPTT
jgi:uncharacterized membrane protein YbhN (UPF0104 family)